jgi:hypothetical protein
MDYKFFLNGIINILTYPKRNWENAEKENITTSKIRNSFLLPLVILISITSFFGSLLFANAELSPIYSVMTAIKNLILILITVYASALIIKEITYPMDLGRDFRTSLIIVVYSFTPFLLCMLVSTLFESFLFVNIIGFYGLYIFWTGAEKFLNPAQYKKMPLLIASTITLAGIYIATNLVLSMVVDRFFFAFFD